MTEFVQDPVLMVRADDVFYFDVLRNRFLDATSGMYLASVGQDNSRVLKAI